nr:MAG TPA: protein of unknown function (DUF4113) [Caudoviricetes sp.]DAX16988.1 MAG TPA: protein of unknown function (DUF4113) [Caudoviricetes sp.]
MFFLRVHIISLLNLQMIDKINQRYGTKTILLGVRRCGKPKVDNQM